MVVTVDGAELFYTSRGTGPVCLVPTAVGTKPYERQMPPQLSDRLQLVFVDLRGGGQSTGDPTALTFDQVAADFEAVRVDLGADRVAIVGHSILEVLALEYGRRCPTTVSHVVTVGTPPRGGMAWLGQEATQFFERDASDERKGVLGDNLAKLPPGTHTLWDGIEAVLPTATRHLFPRSGHQPFVEEPDEFTTIVADWMKL